MTGKQEEFARLVAEGATQSAAYRQAYDAEGMKPSSIASEASRLMEHPEVSKYIADARAAARSKAVWSLEVAVERLQALNDRCLTELLDGTKVSATALRGFLDTLRELNRLCSVDDELSEQGFETFISRLAR